MKRRGMIASVGLLAASGFAASAAKAETNIGVAMIDRLVESVNSRDWSKLDQIYAAGSDYVNHQVLVGAPSSIGAREEFKKYLAQRVIAFPDLILSYDVAFATMDMVAVNLLWRGTHKGEYLGVSATMKMVTWNSTDLFRIKDGMFSDHWGAVDLFGLQRQLKG